MINKQSLWFITIFSLVLVLSIYYITMPDDLLIGNNSKTEKVNLELDETETTIEESELLVTMRVNLDDEREKEIKNLKTTLTNEESTAEEKNNAFEQIKYLTNLTTKEEEIEKEIKEKYKIDSFVKIDNNKVKVTAISDKHNFEMANDIMKTIQKQFTEKVITTVQFEK